MKGKLAQKTDMSASVWLSNRLLFAEMQRTESGSNSRQSALGGPLHLPNATLVVPRSFSNDTARKPNEHASEKSHTRIGVVQVHSA